MKNIFKIPASQEIIDLEIVLSDLKDIPLTQQERAQNDYYDRYAAKVGDVGQGDSNIPVGKRVR